MAPQPRSITDSTTVTTTPVRRRTRRRRTTRTGAATGIGMSTTVGVGNSTSAMNFDSLAAHIQGYVSGFADANGITTQQAFAGLKKSLTW